jgi:hypothetical protein
VPKKAMIYAGSAIKLDETLSALAPKGTRRPRTAGSKQLRKSPSMPATSFAPYRSLPMPEPLPGNWKIRTQYENGAFQLGVINYPYTPADRGAKSDLDGVIHRSLDHPVIPLTMWNGTSAPHNAITGRATTSRFGLDIADWYKSEMKRAYEVTDFAAWHEAKASSHAVGVRSEQKIGVGI